MKKIAIIIVNFNGEKNTIQCLESISKLKASNFKLKVIVVDNGSTNDVSLISNYKFQLRLNHDQISNFEFKFIRSQENLGFSEGNNIGIRSVLDENVDYILLLNNDTSVDTYLIEELLKVAEGKTKIGIVVPKIYFYPGLEFHKGKYKKFELGKVIWYAGGIMDWRNVIGKHRGVDEVDSGKYEKIEETDFASGCCMLIKKELFDSIGFFDKKYFLYYEDNDFSQKAIRAGYRIIYVPKAILWHKNAGSTGGSGSDLQDYYITRNRLLFGMRYCFLKSKLFLIKQSLNLLMKGRRWQRRGVLDFYLQKFEKGSFVI